MVNKHKDYYIGGGLGRRKGILEWQITVVYLSNCNVEFLIIFCIQKRSIKDTFFLSEFVFLFSDVTSNWKIRKNKNKIENVHRKCVLYMFKMKIQSNLNDTITNRLSIKGFIKSFRQSSSISSHFKLDETKFLTRFVIVVVEQKVVY